MECTQIDDLLMDYLYQELAPEQNVDFRAHLDSCDRCAREVRELQGVRQAVRELPVLEPSKALTAQLLHQAAEAQKPAFPWLRQLWELLQPRRNFYAVAAAASLVVVLFVGYALRQGRLTPSFPAAERAVAEAPAAAPVRPTSPAAPAPVLEPTAGPAGAPVPTMAGEASLDRAAVTGKAKDAKLAGGKSATAYPVRLDSESVQREKAAGDDLGFDSSNAGRLADAKKGGFGLVGRGAPEPDQAGARTRGLRGDGNRPSFADQPKRQVAAQTRMPQTVARGAQAAPVLNAAAGGQAAGMPRAAPPQVQAPAQAQRAAPRQEQHRLQAPAAPAAPQDEAEEGYYRRQGSAGAPQAGPQPALKQRSAANSLGNRDENARDKDDGRGFAQAPTDQRSRMRANVDYKVALGVPCEQQLKLLEDFISRYPQDRRVKEAKIRIAVCRARLTGRSEDVDEVLRSIEQDRRKKSLREAEQRAAPDRAGRRAPAQPMAERQTVQKARQAAPKAAGRPRAPAKTDAARAARPTPAKPTAKAKASPAGKAAPPAGKAAPPTATAAKGRKTAPRKAAEKAPSKPATATTAK